MGTQTDIQRLKHMYLRLFPLLALPVQMQRPAPVFFNVRCVFLYLLQALKCFQNLDKSAYKHTQANTRNLTPDTSSNCVKNVSVLALTFVYF